MSKLLLKGLGAGPLSRAQDLPWSAAQLCHNPLSNPQHRHTAEAVQQCTTVLLSGPSLLSLEVRSNALRGCGGSWRFERTSAPFSKAITFSIFAALGRTFRTEIDLDIFLQLLFSVQIFLWKIWFYQKIEGLIRLNINLIKRKATLTFIVLHTW